MSPRCHNNHLPQLLRPSKDLVMLLRPNHQVMVWVVPLLRPGLAMFRHHSLVLVVMLRCQGDQVLAQVVLLHHHSLLVLAQGVYHRLRHFIDHPVLRMRWIIVRFIALILGRLVGNSTP